MRTVQDGSIAESIIVPCAFFAYQTSFHVRLKQGTRPQSWIAEAAAAREFHDEAIAGWNDMDALVGKGFAAPQACQTFHA